MRLLRKTLNGTGIVLATLDLFNIYYGISACIYGDYAINATAQIDGTLSDLTNKIQCLVSQSTNTITVTFPTDHQLSGTGDYVYIQGTGLAGVDGVYNVASVSSTTVLTVTSGTSQTVASRPAIVIPIKRHSAFIASASVTTTPVFPSVSATTLNPVTLPYSAFILNCPAYTAGQIIMDIMQPGIR